MIRSAIVALSLLLVTSPVWATPMKTYRDAKITAQVPAGWKVTVNHAAGVLVAQRNPRSQTSPTILVTMRTYQRGVTATKLLNQAFAGMGGKVKILNRQVEQNGNAIQVIARLTKNGMTVRVGALALASATQGRSIFAAFMARQRDFNRFGGMKTLHTVTFSIRAANAPVATGPRNKPNYTKLARGKLAGKWQQVGLGGMMNRYDMSGRVTSTDMRGSGTMYRFTRSGYEVLYHAKLRSGVCTSKAQMSERGRYSYNGTTLTLRPYHYSGTICTCCNGRNTKRINKRRIPTRRYRVFGLSGQHALVLRGKCAPYMVDASCSSTAAIINGKKHDLTRDFVLR